MRLCCVTSHPQRHLPTRQKDSRHTRTSWARTLTLPSSTCGALMHMSMWKKTIAHASSLVHVKVRTLGSTSHQTVTLCTSWTRSALYRPTTSQSMRRGAKFRQYTVWTRLQRTHIMRHQTASKAHQQHYSLQMSAVDIQRRIAQQRVCKVHHMQRPTCHRPRHLWTSATLFRHQRRWPLVPRKTRSPLRRTRGGDSSAQRREIPRP